MTRLVAFGLFPYVLPSGLDPARGLTATRAATDPSALRIALARSILGMELVAAYFTFVHRKFAGRVSAAEDAD